MPIATIDNFKSEIAALGGLAKGNRFQVILPARPTGEFLNRELSFVGGQGGGYTRSQISLLCKRANLPGKQILSADRTVASSFQKIAYGYASEDVNLSFLLTENGLHAKEYFERWQQAAVNTTDNNYHYPRYKNEYSADVEIHQLSKSSGNSTYKVKLISAYPTTVSAIEYSDDAEGYLELNVQLSYKRWEKI